MPYSSCQVCSKEIYVKPSHLKKGWGKYCSIECRTSSQLVGQTVHCEVCQKSIYRSVKELKKSKSGLYFCTKSCQTIWRNKVLFSGINHANWKHGLNAYRRLMDANKPKICQKCKLTDSRVLVVHHVDRDRKNNNLDNLVWLCCNCHFLEHHGG